MAVARKVSDAASSTEPKAKRALISPPNFQSAVIKIEGTGPLVQNKFSAKMREKMIAKQESGSQSTKGVKREAKDFDECYNGARHIAVGPNGGWDGFAASSVRAAMISACRIVGFKMTIAKLSLFVEADGRDEDGTPLVRIYGEPRMHVLPVRNETGVADVRARPMYDDWHAFLRITWDGDQFSANDIVNLLSRVGMQVGIGEGRPDSKDSAGCGWGTFRLAA